MTKSAGSVIFPRLSGSTPYDDGPPVSVPMVWKRGQSKGPLTRWLPRIFAQGRGAGAGAMAYREPSRPAGGRRTGPLTLLARPQPAANLTPPTQRGFLRLLASQIRHRRKALQQATPVERRTTSLSDRANGIRQLGEQGVNTT